MKNIAIAIMITVVLLFAAETALAETGTISGTIVSFSITTSPDSPVDGTAPCEKTFNVETNELAQISWYFNGNKEKTSSNTTTSSFTRTASEGTHNVTVVASSEHGTVNETWAWKVQPKPTPTPTPEPGRSSAGRGGTPLLYTEINSPKTIIAGSDFNITVDVDYCWSTETQINAPEGWKVSRENGTNRFTLEPPKDAEGNYTVWINTTTPFSTKEEQITLRVESQNQSAISVTKNTSKETIQTQTTQTPFSVNSTPTPTPTATTQVLESRMTGDIIDRIISGLQAFVGSVFKIFGF